MPIRHRRDVTTVKAPAKDEIQVGEIVLNSKTGKMYIVQASYDENKKAVVKQSVIEFAGKVVCGNEDAIPDVEFSDVSEFCCYGDTVLVEMSGLDRVTNYKYNMVELTANNAVTDIEASKDKMYIVGENTPNEQQLKSVTIPININVNKEASAISVFKFSAEVDNEVLTEKVLSIKCKDCGGNTPAESVEDNA
tara:strand:+ start:16 stop:594 length:579 start_codon:yes stop_codon:yes gene_type:complete